MICTSDHLCNRYANGPVGMVFFYEKEVQDKAIELGLTTRETIKKRKEE